MHLGYNQMVAQKAVKKTSDSADKELDLSELITLSLKNIP